MKLVVIESPFAPPRHVRDNPTQCEFYEARNRSYLRVLALWCLGNKWAPYASHAMLTRWLDDSDAEQRSSGIVAGLAWAKHAELVVVGVNHGISDGMQLGIDAHRKNGIPVTYLWLESNWRDWALRWPRSGVDLHVRETKDEKKARRWIENAA